MMDIFWVHESNGIGSAFGYTTFTKKLMGAMAKKGVTFSGASPVAIHMMPPYWFRLRRFKKNVLFTMFEFDKLPRQWHSYLDRSDLVIVPCQQNKRIFSESTETKVEICPGGVDAELFPYVRRGMCEPFTFLFVGDNNPRKGTYHIAQAWEMWNEKYSDIADKTQLIMKMTAYDKEQELVQQTSNSYLDYRILPLTEKDSKRMDLPTLPALYEYAHAFIFTTMGEGWGLPLCEAMSTGLPCIYTPFGGTEDTAADEYAYSVEHGMKEVNIVNPMGGDLDPVCGADPVIGSIVDRMHEIYTHYDQALEKGRRAAEVMREQFGWDKAADAFIDIMKRNFPEVA